MENEVQKFRKLFVMVVTIPLFAHGNQDSGKRQRHDVTHLLMTRILLQQVAGVFRGMGKTGGFGWLILSGMGFSAWKISELV